MGTPPVVTITPAPAVKAPVPIVVAVDGSPLEFANGASAIQEGSRILVPLRGIFVRLGAKVKYDPITQSIHATKNQIDILLRIGGTTAVVNGTPTALSTPAELLGTTTMVPLRFISEALGAKVKWDGPSHAVLITTAETLAANLAAGGASGTTPTTPTTTPATTPTPTTAAPVLAPDVTVTGVVTAMDVSIPNLTVHMGDATTADLTVTLTPDARVLEKRGDDPAMTTTLAKLHMGDQVTIRRNQAGLGYDVEADFVEKQGAFKSLTPGDNGVNHLTLADDSVVDLPATTAATLAGNPVTLTDLKTPMLVTVRVNPTSKLGTAVFVTLPEVKVTALTLDGADTLLKANAPVKVALVGTPGSQATVSIAGLPTVTNLMLTESDTTPGTYAGAFTVPPGFALDKAAVTGALTLAGTTSPVFTSPATLSIDSQPPAISDLEPADGSTVTDKRPDIGGELSDIGTGIDPTQGQLMLNGVDVSAQMKVTKSHFILHPIADLPAGTSKLVVTVKDMAGNVAQKEWVFSIVAPASPIKVVTTNAPEGQALLAGDTLKVHAEGVPGATAKFSIGANVVSGMMTEDMPGVYNGTYLVQKGDSLTNASVTVTITPPGGGADVKMASNRPVTISAGPPVAPVIDQPLEGESTTEYVMFTGHGTPNSTVRLTVSFAGKVIILNKSGSAANLDVTVGNDGTWSTDFLTLDTHGASNVTYTANAVTVLKDGEVSSAATVHFKK